MWSFASIVSNITTARKRSCGKLIFLHLSIILFTGVGGLALGLGRYASESGGVHPLVAPPGYTPLGLTTPYGQQAAVRILL